MLRVRAFILGGVLLGALASARPAAAADIAGGMPLKAPINAAYYDWTGFYVGINAGYGFGKSQTDALFSDASMGTPLFATSSSSKLDGLIAGAQTGYNWQSGLWLFGLEADIQTTSQHAGPTYVCPGAICNATITDIHTPVTVTHDNKLDWFATLRGRLGATVTPDA